MFHPRRFPEDGADMERSGPPASPRRVAFATLGCRLNQFDTEAMKAALPDGAAWRIVPWDAEADVYVLNSCTVTGKADQKCRQLARSIKRRRPRARLVVAGCYAQAQPEKVAAIDGVDAVVGTVEKDDPGAWLAAVLADPPDAPLLRVAPFPRRLPFGGAPLTRFAGHSRAFVKIQDGCDLRCAYCLIWRARGPARSRPRDEVLAQAATLLAGGHHELVLAGVNLGSYGRDRGEPDALAALVAELLARLPALRLRLSSLHPNELSPALLAQVAAAAPRLRPHLHLSLQSGDDAVLGRMRRPYRVSAAREAALAFAGAAGPGAAIGADVIAGYPGETEEEFARTQTVLESLPLAYLHVFRFSPRPGTPAAALPQLAPAVVTVRAAALRRLDRQRQRAFAASLVGAWREAVVEDGDAPPGWRPATTDNYATALVPDEHAPGSLVRLRLAAGAAGALVADAVEPLAPAPAAGGERA